MLYSASTRLTGLNSAAAMLYHAPRNPQRPGRKRLDSRKVLCGILFVLYTGIRWEFLR